MRIVVQKSAVAEIMKGIWSDVQMSDWIEKSKKGEQKSEHKYIWRQPKNSGDGYDYIYEDDQIKKPFDMLLKFFKVTKAAVKKLYTTHNIEKDYKATEEQFASHVLEYEAHKDKWDKRFSKIENAKNYQNPKTMDQAKKTEDKADMKPVASTKEKSGEKSEPKFKPNNTLMRKVWAIMNPEKAKQADIAIANMNAEKAKEVAEKTNTNKENQSIRDMIEYTGTKTDRNGKEYKVGKPTAEFWTYYKTHKEELKADGIRVNKPKGGEWQIFDFNSVPADNVESVEVESAETQEEIKQTADAIVETAQNLGMDKEQTMDYVDALANEVNLNPVDVEAVKEEINNQIGDENKPHGNEIAMLGNQNAKKYGLTDEEYSHLVTKVWDNINAGSPKSAKEVLSQLEEYNRLSDELKAQFSNEVFTVNVTDDIRAANERYLQNKAQERQSYFDNLPEKNVNNVSFNSKAEASDFIKNNIADNIDMSNVKESDVKVIEPILNQISDRLKRLGLSKFKGVGFNTRHKDVVMAVDGATGEISINLNLVRNPAKLWEAEQKYKERQLAQMQKFHPENNYTIDNVTRWSAYADENDAVRATVDHEIGHYLLNSKSFKFSDIIRKLNDTRNGYDNFGNATIGMYHTASLDSLETIAELFAMYMGKERTLLPKDIIDTIESITGIQPMFESSDFNAKLSQAMMGNDNAAGEHNVESTPTVENTIVAESKMKKEQEQTKKAREKAKLPKINKNKLDARTSALDDYSYDPNAENYAFKDTGYIAGARKETALLQLRSAGRNKTRLRAEDIDWEGVEENSKAAVEVITKSNIFGQVDWDSLKANGMTGSAGFLIDRIYAAAGNKPENDTPEARKNYVIAINGMRDRFEECKTVDDVLNTFEEIKEEMNGVYRSVKESEQYKQLADEYNTIQTKAYEIDKEYTRLQDEADSKINGEARIYLETLFERLKKDKKVVWNARIPSTFSNLDYYISPSYNKKMDKAYYDNLMKEITEKRQEIENKYNAELNDFVEKNKADMKDNNGYYNSWSARDKVEDKLFALKAKMKIVMAMEGEKARKENPLYEAWKELGTKFKDLGRSKTYWQHRSDCRRGEYDNWEWANKERTVTTTTKEKEWHFEFRVADNYSRKGGREVKAKTTQELKDMFNLRDVQSGNWVLKDPDSAKWHVENLSASFADLCDVTGIPDNLVSLNGRLAMAIGARGTGNAGWRGSALAHYEPIEQVINITKMKGGGALGHEWFHSFDNLIREAMGMNESTAFMTNPLIGYSDAVKRDLKEYLDPNTDSWTKRKLARTFEKKNIKLPENPTELFQMKIAVAFDNLVNTMTKGDTPIKDMEGYSYKEYKERMSRIANARKMAETPGQEYYTSYYKTGYGADIVEMSNKKTLDEAMEFINNEKGRKGFNKNSLIELAVAYFGGEPDDKTNKKKKGVLVHKGRTGTQFLADAENLDGKTRDYWSSPHEMAARAFAAYVDDKLREQGRFNDYLANYTHNEDYDQSFGRVAPYPETGSEERKRINEAFENLFRVVREQQAIRKAIEILDKPFVIMKNGRLWIKKGAFETTEEKAKPMFIKKNGRIWVRKSL